VARDKQVRVVILGASPDSTNMGVNLLAVGSVKCIVSRFPDAQISFFDYGKKPSVHMLRVDGGEIIVPKVNIRFSKKLYLPNNIAWLLVMATFLKVLPSASLRRWAVAKNRWLRLLDESDLVLSIAGGDSFSDIYGLRRLLYVSLPQILALVMRRKLVLLPQTIGPFRGGFSKQLARYILKRAELVYARDERSLAQAVALSGKPDRCAFCYDVGFVVDAIAPAHMHEVPAELQPGVPLVGLNVSGLLFHGGYTHNNMFGLQTDYRHLVYELIDFLICQKGASVLLVPHVFGHAVNSESDWVVCNQIWENLSSKHGSRLNVLRGAYDQSELKYVIGQCKFFVGSRMHACIAAVSQGVPAVSVAYSEKFVGVMEKLDIAYAVADARSLNTQAILSIVGQAFDRRAEIRRGLLESMPHVKSAVLRLFDAEARAIEEASLVR
jgi:colanic acid/amylovoran biosynthesis protein